MADVVAEQGLVQVMRELLADPDGDERSWLGTRLEVSRRLRTDPEFQERWRAHSAALTRRPPARGWSARPRVGALRDDVPVAGARPATSTWCWRAWCRTWRWACPSTTSDAVLDLVESSVRRPA